MNKYLKKKIEDASIIASEKQFEGCNFTKLDSELYLVFAYLYDDYECGKVSLYGKIAKNCDDIQCDYGWDWVMPIVKGEVINTEILCDGMSCNEISEEFYRLYEMVKKEQRWKS